jgi:hypothetical protein
MTECKSVNLSCMAILLLISSTKTTHWRSEIGDPHCGHADAGMWEGCGIVRLMGVGGTGSTRGLFGEKLTCGNSRCNSFSHTQESCPKDNRLPHYSTPKGGALDWLRAGWNAFTS